MIDRLYKDPVADLIMPNILTDFNMLYPNMNFNRPEANAKRKEKEIQIKEKK
jgi:hypothetical protein